MHFFFHQNSKVLNFLGSNWQHVSIGSEHFLAPTIHYLNLWWSSLLTHYSAPSHYLNQCWLIISQIALKITRRSLFFGCIYINSSTCSLIRGLKRTHLPTPCEHYCIMLNTLRPRQNGRHFTDDTFNRILVNENVRISIKFSPKFVPKGPSN